MAKNPFKKGDIVELTTDWAIHGRPKGSRATVLSIDRSTVCLMPKGKHDGRYAHTYLKFIKRAFKPDNFYNKY